MKLGVSQMRDAVRGPKAGWKNAFRLYRCILLDGDLFCRPYSGRRNGVSGEMLHLGVVVGDGVAWTIAAR